MTTLLLLALYALCVGGVTATARWIRRPIPRSILLLSALLPILFFTPGLLAGRTPLPMGHFAAPPWSAAAYAGHYNPYLDDVVKQFLPWMKAVRLAWSEGSLPWRNVWSGSGTPLATNGSSAAFSPLTLLATPLPLPAAFLFMAVAKLLLAVSGTWLWLTELRLPPRASFLGAVAFGFSFSMTPWIFFPHTAVLALWPWALFAIEALADGRVRGRAWALLTGVLTLWPLAGHIESAAMGAAFVGLWLSVRLVAGDLREPGAVVPRIALAALIALGLSAFFVLPHGLAIEASNRRALVEDRFWAPLLDGSPHGPRLPQLFVTALFPRAFGDGMASPSIPGARGSFPETGLAFFGVTGWAAALLCLLPGGGRRRTEAALGAVLFTGLAAAALLWPFAEAADLVPGLRLIVPYRFLSWVALSGAALAAFGVARVEERRTPDRWTGARVRGAGAVAIVALLGTFALLVHFALRPAHAEAGGLASQMRALGVTLVALAGFALTVSLSSLRRWRMRPWATGALALLCAAELFYQGRRLYRFALSDPIRTDGPLLTFLRERPRPFRVVGDGYVLFPNTNVFAAVEEVRTHDPLERRDYVEWLDSAAGYSPGVYFKDLRDVNAPALDFLNARYFVGRPNREAPGAKWRKVYEGPDGTVFENDAALPRVFAPELIRFGVRTVAEPLDARREVIVEPENGGRGGGTRANGPVAVRNYRETTNRVSFDARATADGTFLVTSLLQDGGWSARSGGGGRVSAARANGPFLALELSAGDHAVDLRYAPPGFRQGAGATAGTVLLLGAAALRQRRRRKRRAERGVEREREHAPSPTAP